MDQPSPNFAYETVLRYAINTGGSIAAGYFGLDAAQTSSGESLAFALLTAAIAAGSWAWGIYRSRQSQRLLDASKVPGTTIVTQENLAASLPSNVLSNQTATVVGGLK